MLKLAAFLTLIATGLALPLEDGNIKNSKVQALVQPFPQSDQSNQHEEPKLPESLVPQQDGSLPNPPALEGKPDEDLKTDPTFWFGYRGGYGGYRGYGGYYGYPIQRRSYYPSYHYRPRVHSYYVPQNYYWESPSYYW